MKLPDSIEQVVVSCHREGGCQYYIRTVLKDVYIWKLSNSEQLRRDHDLHLQRLGSMTDFLIPSSEGVYLCNGQKFLNPGYNITLITPMNGEITYGCSIKDSIHSVLSFFSIHNHTQGIVYGTRAGCVYFLDVKKNEEKKIYVFEQKQEVKYINLFHANHSSHLLIIG
ncbi:hypothetical protein BDB01DRAFT_534242 [Pilobolus umbonatus]|nr:hypothetical protein BDB01DRAFT_534242 [Pilobolus umbonatus]